MTIKSKLKTFFFLDDEYVESEGLEERAETKKPQKQPINTQNVVNLHSVPKMSNAQKASKVILAEPATYAEATEIADHLKNRRAVVVNLQRIDQVQGRQILDFLSGVVYTLGGDMQKIGVSIFLCAPDNVEVSGNISDLFPEQDLHKARW
ncbi:cell division protein SepF [Neobacillus mesonae]|uniref:cell division protein SepF n=1 Tax=Neobacillus mesonae TaxID=1193713 RepID=UPI000829513E|nr:cell division protein SepF [Neobacillus mesonae]